MTHSVFIRAPAGNDLELSGFVRKDGVIAPVAGVNRDNIRFADVNGDGRDDYLRVGATGQVHAYFNYPSSGDVQKPAWKEKLSWAPGASKHRGEDMTTTVVIPDEAMCPVLLTELRTGVPAGVIRKEDPRSRTG